ncbi:hypothetical protein GCM10028801_06720 [Nocardioides maradonensis]
MGVQALELPDARVEPGASRPAPVFPLAATAVVITVVAAVGAHLAVSAVADLGRRTAVTTTLVWVLSAVALLPLGSALRAIARGRTRATLLAAGDLVGARREAAAGRESAAVANGWALAVVIVATLLGFVAANHGAVAHTFLRWDLISSTWREVAKGFWINIQVSIGAEVLVLVFGLVLAVMRLMPGRSGRPLRWLATSYVDVFRAIPSIIVLYLVGFGLALAEVPVIRDMTPLWLAIIALTLTYSGYVAEVYRAGIESLHPSQWAAARSLGLSYGMTLRTVIVPQAVRRIVPPLLNDFIGLQKDTALIGVMGVADAFTRAQLESSNVFNLSPVIVVALLFVVITIPQARFVDRLIAREQRKSGRA